MHKLKEENNIYYFLNQKYLLMECVHLMGNAQLLRTWTQVGDLYPYFLFTMIFLLYLPFETAIGKI